MSKRINFDWSKKLDITEHENSNSVVETFPSDKLGRKKYAEFLTIFLSSEGFDIQKKEKYNYVLNLNSEWGSGKTYFLRRWAHELKPKYPVVYINSWQQDYSDDPLMTVVSSLLDQLKEQAPETKEKFKPPKKLIGLLKAAAPAIMRGITKRYLGIDPVKIMESDDEIIQGEDIKDDSGESIDMSLAASNVVDYLIKEHDAKSKAIISLKVTVESWVSKVVECNKSFPAFIFIDELDRCRPSYAIEMLETIKHIFDIPGVVFVIATDTEQLQHAVKSIYGNDFDARTYLARFFNSRFSLKSPNLENLLGVHCAVNKLSQEYFDHLDLNIWPMNEGSLVTLENITTILNAFSLSPRTAIQVTERIIATISHLPEKANIDLLMLTTLLCIREKNENLYEEIISKKFERKEEKSTIELGSYLVDYFNIYNAKFKFSLNPTEHSNSDNNYQGFKKGIYLVGFDLYLSKIFSAYFGYGQDEYIFYLPNNGKVIDTPIEDVVKKLNKLNYTQREKNHGESANLWFEYLYFFHKLDSVNISIYRDLVELASAIDWIEGE